MKLHASRSDAHLFLTAGILMLDNLIVGCAKGVIRTVLSLGTLLVYVQFLLLSLLVLGIVGIAGLAIWQGLT